MRLFAILRAALRRAGGSVVLNNVVTGAEQAGGRVTALRTRVGLREERRGADWVVLATGGVASGGARARLELDGARDGARAAGHRRPRPRARSASGPATSTTIRWAAPASPWTASCAPSTRPASASCENVVVAGATLAGAEPWREKSGDGLSLATGYRAAELVLAASTPAAAVGS